jgi:hypothetical protein
MMSAAIDACEQIEALGYDHETRDKTTEHEGQRLSAFEIVTSAVVYPEHVRYAIIHDRHGHGADAPYVPETARILRNMADAASELVGASPATPAADRIERMLRWYPGHAVPLLRNALQDGTR